MHLDVMMYSTLFLLSFPEGGAVIGVFNKAPVQYKKVPYSFYLTHFRDKGRILSRNFVCLHFGSFEAKKDH